MKEKIQLLMTREQLKSVQLAKILGIQSPVVSHLLSGRNKPSCDLLQKILRSFPQINPDWLLLDSKQMYRTDPAETPAAGTSPEPSAALAEPRDLFTGTVPPPAAAPASAEDDAPDVWPAAAGEISRRAEIKRIVVFYDDDTFESFDPKN